MRQVIIIQCSKNCNKFIFTRYSRKKHTEAPYFGEFIKASQKRMIVDGLPGLWCRGMV